MNLRACRTVAPRTDKGPVNSSSLVVRSCKLDIPCNNKCRDQDEARLTSLGAPIQVTMDQALTARKRPPRGGTKIFS